MQMPQMTVHPMTIISTVNSASRVFCSKFCISMASSLFVFCKWPQTAEQVENPRYQQFLIIVII